MLLTRDQIDRHLQDLDGWTFVDNAVRKQFTFDGFPRAIDFLNRLAPRAQAADHHPDIEINYKRVTLTYSTHSEGGVTAKDVEGAAMADSLA